MHQGHLSHLRICLRLWEKILGLMKAWVRREMPSRQMLGLDVPMIGSNMYKERINKGCPGVIWRGWIQRGPRLHLLDLERTLRKTTKLDLRWAKVRLFLRAKGIYLASKGLELVSRCLREMRLSFKSCNSRRKWKGCLKRAALTSSRTRIGKS